MAAMFAIYLRETEYFAIGKFAAKLPAYIVQVVDFFLAKRKAFLFVVSFQVFNLDNGFGCVADGEDILIEVCI